jgi:hypothetical protein
MATNPLHKYFRQPKVFIKLPSGGIYSRPGNVQGDVNQLPIYGMTGMDEIIMKTPDSLLSGASTAQVISSCCPNIKDPWDISIVDITMILSAIRIATFGSTMQVTNKCIKCATENEYDLDLNRIIEHYMTCNYEDTVVLTDLVIKLRPLNYKTSTEFNIVNFQLQQKMAQADSMEAGEEKQKVTSDLFNQLANLQTEIFKSIIDSIDIGSQVVTDRSFIDEWITNCDKNVFDSIKEVNQKNNKEWAIPPFQVICDNCQHETNLSVEMDESNFFVSA